MATDFTLENLSKSLDDFEFDTQNFDDDDARTPLDNDFHVLSTARSLLRQYGMNDMDLSLSLSRGEETQFVMPTATPIFSRLRYQMAPTVVNFNNFDSDWKNLRLKRLFT